MTGTPLRPPMPGPADAAVPTALGGASDVGVAADAAAADPAAFAALYERHVDVAWRTALAVRGNIDDATEATSKAFVAVVAELRQRGSVRDPSIRTAVLTEVCRASIESLRQSTGTHHGPVSDQASALVKGSTDATTDEASSPIVATFRRLPAQARAAIWLWVEGLSPEETAAVVGVAPDIASQLIAQSRALLGQEFLRISVGSPIAERCRSTMERLATYTAGTLPEDEVLPMEAHLAFCADCLGLAQALKALDTTLRPLAQPLPAATRASLAEGWRRTFPSTPSPAPSEEQVAGAEPVTVSPDDPGDAHPEATPDRAEPAVAVQDEPPAVAAEEPAAVAAQEEPPDVGAEEPADVGTEELAAAATEGEAGGGGEERAARDDDGAGIHDGETALGRSVIVIRTSMLIKAALGAVIFVAVALAIGGAILADRDADDARDSTAARSRSGSPASTTPGQVPSLAPTTDMGTPIAPEAQTLVRRVAKAAAERDFSTLQNLLAPADVERQMALLESPGVLDQLVLVLKTHPSITDGYRRGYYYPGFAVRPFQTPLNELQRRDAAFLRVTEGAAPRACNGYRGLITGFEARSGAPGQYTWNGVAQQC